MLVLESNRRHAVTFTLNGETVVADVEPRLLLTDCLRHQFGLTGVHVGCEHGVCGACTVRVNGRALRGCLLLTVQVEGQSVETVEHLCAVDGSLNDLQEAFRRHHALQCGFCTPGILLSLGQLLEEEGSVCEDRVRQVLAGHLCRCTGYQGIVAAAMEVALAIKTGD